MHPQLKKILLEPWTPARLRPILWLEARRGGSLFQTITGTTPSTADSDVVGTWKDLSGNANDLTATANDTTRPTLQGTTTNPVVRFDGSNDLLRIASSLGLYNSGACSTFVSIKPNTPATSSRLVSEASSTSANSFYDLVCDSTTNTTAAFVARNEVPTFLLNNSPKLTSAFTNTDSVLSYVDTGSVMSIRSDKGTQASTSYTRSGTVASDRFTLGALIRNTTSSWWAGDVYGIVVIKGISLTEMDQFRLISYMAKLQGRIV